MGKIPKMRFLAHILAERAAKGALIAPCIYLTSYADREVTRLPDLLDFLDAQLIDIRFAPSAGGTPLQWRKDYLRLLLGDRYRHIPHLGNRLAKDSSRSSIQNLDLGIRIITQMGANLLLMCECRNVEDCHRATIAQSLVEQGFETQEINDWSSRK